VLKNFPGVVGNTGVEFQINTINIRSKIFQWTSSFNLTSAKNKLLEFPGLESSSYASTYIIGKPLNTYIGSQYLNVDPTTGLYQFLNKDKQITLSPTTADYLYVGTTDPDFYGGLQNSLTYKGWEFQFLFEFRNQKGVHPVYSSTGLVGGISNQPGEVWERWQQTGDNKPYQRYTQMVGPARNATIAIFNSDARLTDASFVRFKNVSLSYSLPGTRLNKTGIEKLRLFVEAQNLFVITNYKGADPENQSTRALPPLRMITVGIQMKL